MRYLLDTNTVSDLYQSDSAAYLKIMQHIRKLNEDDDLLISILTIFELDYGYENSPEINKPSLLVKIKHIEDQLSIIPLKREQGRWFGRVKHIFRQFRKLNKNALKKHNIDIMIGSTAISEGCILVSADKIYSELAELVPELQVENWTLGSAGRK